MQKAILLFGALLGSCAMLGHSIWTEALTYWAEGNKDTPGIFRYVKINCISGIADVFYTQAQSIFGIGAILSGGLLGYATAVAFLERNNLQPKRANFCLSISYFLLVATVLWNLQGTVLDLQVWSGWRFFLLSIVSSALNLTFLWSIALIWYVKKRKVECL